uniref:AB hydrolase-1 domain-containing protein n=1 Tax=Bigelowiella natans TaxID=227086 RepID=A0A7S2KHS3_BIGNA|mmetsp:Transcript_1161/g.1790  ORF Transcript_1161/g.1790 Transcript_1161/m.1790 type:complete len:285 (+) Transcript_1161:216-1070(+)
MSEPAIYAETVRRIMQKNGGYQKAIFMGHSIGSVYLTWIINNKPQLLSKVVLIDPVCLLLHHSKVLWNFLYARPPDGFLGLVTERLVVRDPNVDFRLRRHFTWYQNVLWLSDIPHHVNTYIILSENDTFVPSQRVMEYIVDCQKRGEICKQQRLENYDENIREEDRNQQQHKEDDEGIVVECKHGQRKRKRTTTTTTITTRRSCRSTSYYKDPQIRALISSSSPPAPAPPSSPLLQRGRHHYHLMSNIRVLWHKGWKHGSCVMSPAANRIFCDEIASVVLGTRN